MKKIGIVAAIAGSIVWMGCGSEGEPNDPVSYMNYVNPKTIDAANRFFAALPAEAKSTEHETSFERVRLGKTLYL